MDVLVLHLSALTVELGRKSRSCVELLCDSLTLSSQINLLCQCYCGQPVLSKMVLKPFSGSNCTSPFSEEVGPV